MSEGRRGLREATGWLGAGLVLGIFLAVAGWAWLGWFATAEAPIAAGPPSFVEESAAAGLVHAYDGEFTFFVGGGVAVFDCDDDGFEDVYLAGGANPAALYRNASVRGGELQFAVVPSHVTDLVDVVGAYPIDIDSDGILDLAVLRLGDNVLLRGLGDCHFAAANEEWGFDGGDEWTAGFSAKWEPGAELPTLAFGNYLILDEERRQEGGCESNVLFRPETVRYAEPIELDPGWCTLSVLFSDWDRSGRRDLRVSNDRHYYRDGQEQLWAIAPGESPRLYTADDGWKPIQIWGMGIATSDVTGDGLPEYYLTSQGDNKLQTLAAGSTQPIYEDIALRRGVTAHRPFAGGEALPSTAWHPEFADVNNDGFMDLYVSKGNVEAMTDHAANDPSNLLLGQPDGTFVESAPAAGLLSFGRSRGAAFADFNLDGWLDLMEVNRRENVRLWRNRGTGTASDAAAANWITLALEQPGTNTHGVGAWVQVEFDDRIIEREITIGGGHAGGRLGWIHFGIGDARAADVRVQWPDGETGPTMRVPGNSFAVIGRGADTPQPWTPESS